MSTGRENKTVNVMRIAAATLVVANHVRALFFQDYVHVRHSPWRAAGYALGSLGHPAVMVFFVLSGFWVGGAVLRAVERGAFRWSTFAISRLSRLWLVLLPALVLTAVLDHIGLHWLSGTSVYQSDPGYHVLPGNLHETSGALVALGNVVFTQQVLVPTYGSNTPLWSLAYELWYYVSFPLLVLAARGSRRWLWVVLLVGVGLFVGPTIAAAFSFWLLGAAVAAYGRRLPTVSGWVAAALGLVVLASMAVDKSRPGFAGDLLVSLTTAALLVSLLRDPKPSSAALRGAGRRVAAGAAFSFSLYAIHFPIAALLSALLIPHIDGRWQPDPLHLGAGVAIVAGIIAVAWAFAWLTERHTDDVRRRLVARLT